ncbi:hypothetical protein PFHG_00435 [Plasmodium falciparum HB3]|uniref:Uncharacterized protein n=1 Tax=Plasmodium falciparum (isolate HB3) TaxID=137071 RepID=A0A0L7K5W9_PLAFX|nr:hypothetical protein PFHG_00435 [Plasmodium falciparum HB3]
MPTHPICFVIICIFTYFNKYHPTDNRKILYYKDKYFNKMNSKGI